MKVNVEVDCTPEEMRRFLGLPDVTKINETYIDNVMRTIQGENNIEQIQTVMKNIAPMGEMGLRFFQQIMESAMTGANINRTDDKPNKK